MCAVKNKNFHVPLPADIYSELKKIAESSKTPATQLARDAIALWLKEVKKSSLHSSIAAYARKNAGGPDDLDSNLEAASIENLLKLDEDR